MSSASSVVERALGKFAYVAGVVQRAITARAIVVGAAAGVLVVAATSVSEHPVEGRDSEGVRTARPRGRGRLPARELSPRSAGAARDRRSVTPADDPDLPGGARAGRDPDRGRHEGRRRHVEADDQDGRRASHLDPQSRGLGEWALLRPADGAGRAHRLRTVRGGTAASRRAPRRGRPPDPDVAGVQLPGRRRRRAAGLVVREQVPRNRPTGSGAPRPGRAVRVPLPPRLPELARTGPGRRSTTSRSGTSSRSEAPPRSPAPTT